MPIGILLASLCHLTCLGSRINVTSSVGPGCYLQYSAPAAVAATVAAATIPLFMLAIAGNC